MSGSRGDLRIPTLTGRVAPGPARGLPVAGEIPTAAGALQGLAARIGALGEQMTRRAAQDTEDQAWQAGTTAGDLNPGTQAEGGGAVSRTAFNRAAADAGQRRLEVMARTELTRLAEAHPTDPEGFGAAAARFRDATAQTLPPTLAARFAAGFDVLALPAHNGIRTAQRRAVADQAVATWTEALPARIAGIEQAAGAALRDPAAGRAYALQEDQALAELVALGPQEAFSFGGRDYPADPSRAGALTLERMARLAGQLRGAGREALAIGAWRAAGGGREWIDNFERRGASTGPSADWTARNAAAGRPVATPDRLAARLPAAWQPIVQQAATDARIDPALFAALLGLESGGRADATSRAGAVGPAQIIPATAANPGFGLPALPADALTDPARAIPWAARYLGALRDRFGGDMVRALAAYNAGPAAVERAEREGRLLPGETRNYLATLLPAVEGAAGGIPLPADEVQRIATRLRGLQAADEQAAAAERAEARATLTRAVTENMAAIGATGRPAAALDPELIARAGADPQEIAERERVATLRFAATTTAANTTDPAALAALAEQFAPGTAAFRADPQAAAQLLGSLRARGVTVQGAALTERLRDLEAEAAASGRAQAVTDDEARAAGVTPERRDEINRGLALTAELARLRDEGATVPPADRAAATARFPVEGPEARENALRLRVMAEAFAARDRAVADDPAGYALQNSPALRTLAQQVIGGELARLPDLIALTRAEQARLGVPEDSIAALPPALGQAIAANLAALPDDAQRMQRLFNMARQVEDPEARRDVLSALQAAGVPAHLVNAARLAPRLGEALAARLAVELGTDTGAFQLTPTETRDIRTVAGDVWRGSDRLGGLRAAQAAATGNATFATIGAAEDQQLQQVATVRGAPGRTLSSGTAREIYAQLYGGVQVVNRPGDQVLAVVPAGTDPDRLARGLNQLLEARLAALPPALRRDVSRGIWVDAGLGTLAFYPQGSPLPLAGPDGTPLTVTVPQALDAPGAAAGAARTNADYLRAQQRAQEQRGRELGAETRTLRPVP